MTYFDVTEPIKIIGIEIRTSNENEKAYYDIPPLWQKFFENQILDKIPHKISSDIYGI